jgi:hypothetical protein
MLNAESGAVWPLSAEANCGRLMSNGCRRDGPRGPAQPEAATQALAKRQSGAGAPSVSAQNGYGRRGCSPPPVEEGLDEGEQGLSTPNHLHVGRAGQHR